MCKQKFQRAENLPFNQFFDPQKPVIHGKVVVFVADLLGPTYI